MRTLEELLLLVSESLSLWLRGFTRMGFWYCLGWTVHILCLFASVLLGPVSTAVATLVFVVGVLALVVALVLMLHALEPRLRAPVSLTGQQRRDVPAAAAVPDLVFEPQQRLPVVAAAIGPFLAVYAVWGLIDEQVNLLFSYNLIIRGSDQADFWSINLSRVSFYVVLAVVAFVLKRLVDLVQRRLQRRWVAVLELLMEGLWVFASFLALAAAAGDLRTWLGSRRVVVGLQNGWTAFLEALPAWQLPFDLTLPEAVGELVRLFWQDLLPGVSAAILLPLVWLALTATVFGWRDFTGQQVLTGGRAQRVADRVRARTTDLGPVTTLAHWASADLRDKYLPVVHAMRLIWRAGPSVVVAYLVWSTLLVTLSQWVMVLARTLAGELTNPELSVYLLFEDLALGLVFVSLTMATYAAAFDRALLGVLGVEARRRRRRQAALSR